VQICQEYARARMYLCITVCMEGWPFAQMQGVFMHVSTPVCAMYVRARLCPCVHCAGKINWKMASLGVFRSIKASHTHTHTHTHTQSHAHKSKHPPPYTPLFTLQLLPHTQSSHQHGDTSHNEPCPLLPLSIVKTLF